ncbi:unnamed protein product [Closterium sp. NIES-53]
MASLRVLAFDHEGRPVQFDMWLDDLQLYLLSDSKDSVSLFDLASGAATAPLTTADSLTRSQWLTRDAAARLAIRNHLPLAECAHFGQHRPAQALDHFLSLDPTSLTVDLLEQYLLVAETSAVAARGTPRPPFVEGCSPSPLAPSYATAAATDVSIHEDVGAASTSAKRRSSKGKGGRGGGGGSGGGGGGSGNGGGGSSGGGGDGGTVGGSGGSSGGGGGSGGSGGSGGGGTGSGGTGTRRVGSGGGQRQQQQRRNETPSPQQLREWFLRGASGGSCPYVIRTGDRAGQTFGRHHTQHRCFSCLGYAWRAEFGDDVELPRWADLLKSRIAIFDLDFDAIVSAMYALSVSAEGDCYRCVPPDPGIATAALGASESGNVPGTAPAEALHTFTLDSVWLTPPGDRSWPVPPLSGGSVWLTVKSSPPLVLYELGSSLYTLATEPSQVAASAQMSASGQAAASCSCRLLSYQTLLWHHRLGHPSLPRLRGMHSRLLVSGLPRSLPPLLPSPAPPCLPCVEGRQHAAPHSSSFPPTTAPLQTLHMDVWGPARVSGQSRERYFLLVVDDYTRYTTDLPVLRLHSDRGGEFSSNLLRDFCRGEGIIQSFTLPESPQQNGIAECRIGLVMEVARTSMIHAAAPQFLWPFAVWYAAHQLNLWPRVSLPETSPTLRWTGEVGDASVFRVWGSRAFVRDTSADKLSPRAIPCVFLGFVPDAPGWQFYHPTSRCVFPSQDVMFDESVPFYRLFPYRSAPPPPPPLFLAPSPPPVDPLPPQGPAPSGVSQVDPLPSPAPVQIGVASGATQGAASEGAEPGGAESEGAETGGTEPGGVETGRAEPGGVATGGAEPEGAEPGGAEPGGAVLEGAESGGAEPQGAASSGASRAGGTGAAGAGITGGTANLTAVRKKLLLLAMEPLERIIDYVNRAKSYNDDLTAMWAPESEKHVMSYIISGLPKEWTAEIGILTCNTPKDMTQLLETLQALELVKSDLKRKEAVAMAAEVNMPANLNATSTPRDFGNYYHYGKKGHKAVDCYSNPNRRNYKGKGQWQQNNDARRGDGYRASGGFNGNCNHCGKYGHKASDCYNNRARKNYRGKELQQQRPAAAKTNLIETPAAVEETTKVDAILGGAHKANVARASELCLLAKGYKETAWFMDSGCTQHMTHRAVWLHNFRESEVPYVGVKGNFQSKEKGT